MFEKMSYIEIIRYLVIKKGNRACVYKNGKKIIILENRRGKIKAIFNNKCDWEKRNILLWSPY